MTITKLTSVLTLSAAMLLAVACDTEDTAPAAAEREAVLDSDELAELDTPHHGERAHDPAERLCQDLACSDDQRAQIDALFSARKDAHEAKRAAKRGAKSEGRKAKREAKRAEAHGLLAAAFRADEFDTSVLGRMHEDKGHNPDKAARHEERLDDAAALVVGLHAILTPAQREQLASQIETRGPRFMHGGKGPGHHSGKGKKGRHGKRHDGESRDGEGQHGKRHDGKGRHGEGHDGEGRHGKHHDGADRHEGDPAARLARHVERFCEPLSCTDEQKTQLSAAFQGAHEQRRDMPKPDHKPLADAFRADTIDLETVRATMVEGKRDGKSAHLEGFGSIIAEVHDVLTPDQRGILADKLETEGMRGVF